MPKPPLLEIDSNPMQRRRKRSASKLSLILLSVFVLLLSAVGLAAFKTLPFVNSVSTANLSDNIRSIVSAVSASPSASSTPAQTRINVLLLGYGGGGHDGGDLTDSIMVLTLDEQTKRTAMISVPRDIWVRIPSDGDNGGFWKVNTAYAIGIDDRYTNKKPEFKGAAGGGNLASFVVGSMLGLKIDYWVAVDFHAFRSTVDALGGVDVNVEKAFTDYYYPRNDNPDIDPSWMTIHFNAGMQHMNGEKAIEYARSRHSLEDGTDFGRSRRQQLLLLAIKNRALSPEGLAKTFGMMDALSQDFRTNMTLGQVRSLADLARGIDPSSVERISLDDTNFLANAQTGDGQDVLVPQGKSWQPIRNYVASVLLDPAVKAEGATVQVFNATAQNGLATSSTTMLNDLGIHTLPPQSLDTAPSSDNEIHDFTQGRYRSTVSFLASAFGARIVSDAPSATEQADITVVLGKSYQPPSIVDSFDPSVSGFGVSQ